MVEEKKRNQFVDIMRGIAMLLVVLGHTMTGSTINSQSSFLFNVIWTLQMPLFILISGYVTRYSKELENKSELIFYLKKRTFSYLLPWFIWTVLVRGVIFGENSFLNPRFILWHMDNGYWFLFSIWTITVIYGISNLIGAKITTNRYKRMLATGGAYILGLLLLAGIGAVFGISFLGIKLTLYYMPFFFAGYLYGQVREKLMSLNHGKMIIDIGVATSLMVWIVLLMRFNLYEISDTGLGVIIRAVASMTGCIALCGLCKGIFCRNTKEKWGVYWGGIHSLEIYTSHYLFLNMLKISTKSDAITILGAGAIFLNYVLTMSVVVMIVMLLNQNMFCRLILFGKVDLK